MSEPPKPDRYQVKNIAGRMDNDILLTGWVGKISKI
jgi:hypothetical protein